MEIVNIAQEIEKKVKALELGRDILKEYAHNKANTIGEYEKKIAITLIKLRNGTEFELDGAKIKNPPVSIMEKIAKGICFQGKIDMEVAEAEYKNGIVGMSAISSELNGYQSIFRHLEQKGVD
ncbi:hypothetical protein LCGC14_1183120 [marine sediment metagenome]|uniref:Uncharacterized protein n=1 Tax=marine sediment metagenome TaxID=412755 RepID=A0A0F9M9A7_9ZZZZ